MLELTERPLITFALFAYKQQQSVAEAVRGALHQDYGPLEIILSDDCSPDWTFDIMAEEATRYSGQHRVVLNRNRRNLGLVQHVNRVMELAKGELIVPAAGADYSLPDRCSRTYELWTRYNRRPDYISLGLVLHKLGSTSGTPKAPRLCTDIPNAILKADCGAVGASSAWHRRLFEVFGPLPEYLYEEDVVLPSRALFLSGVAHGEATVVIKQGDICNSMSAENEIYSRSQEAQLLHEEWLKRRIAALRAFEEAVNKAMQLHLIGHDDGTRYLKMIRKSIWIRALDLDLMHPRLNRHVRSAVLLWFFDSSHLLMAPQAILAVDSPFPSFAKT